MEQINKIELRGNVGNVKIQEYGGSESIRFSLATNYAYKGKDGQPVIETTWHNVTAWSGKGMPDFHKIDKGSLVTLSADSDVRNSRTRTAWRSRYMKCLPTD